MTNRGHTYEDLLQRQDLLLQDLLLLQQRKVLLGAIEMCVEKNLKQTLDVPPWEARKRMLHGHSMNQGLMSVLLLLVFELALYQGLNAQHRLLVLTLRFVLLFSSCCKTFSMQESSQSRKRNELANEQLVVLLKN
jgi:hypothetical protein